LYAPGVNPAAGVWLAFIICALFGWGLNKIMGKPRINWPAWLAGWYVMAFALSLYLIASSQVNAAAELGRHVALYLVPAVLSFLYSRRWRRKNPLSPALAEAVGSDA
jgi:hypothetical protein